MHFQSFSCAKGSGVPQGCRQCGFEGSTAQRLLTAYPKDYEIIMEVI